MIKRRVLQGSTGDLVRKPQITPEIARFEWEAG